ncbi:MAG TPA: cell division protein FtsL [Syntrophales bacterium]|jgi:cell division protein FtsL|nr:cell division protein FtsL [Syntrophales bacterium]HRT61099.1 cell division protein FtsL [Syntrophales bacterium]
MPIVKVARSRTAAYTREGSGAKVSSFILAVCVIVAAALLYVWSHLKNTQLKYQMAEEISVRSSLQEENRKLKVEIATLKSPKRIEAFAREKLDMSYPEREQVIRIQ